VEQTPARRPKRVNLVWTTLATHVPPAVQAKLEVGAPDDKYERQADRVADQVMRMPERPIQRPLEEEEPEELRRKPLAEPITSLLRREAEPEEEEEIGSVVQTKGESHGDQGLRPNVASTIEALRGRGGPLPASSRTYFEPRFGRDFSAVRIHTGGQAAAAARAVHAKAFTVGSNMKANPALQKTLLERILTAKEGHRIGNHTYSHDPMTPSGYRKEYGDLSDPGKLTKFRENYEKNRKYFQDLMKGSKTPFPGFGLARLPGSGSQVKVGGKLVYVEATEAMGTPHVGWDSEFAPNGTFARKTMRNDWKGFKGVQGEPDAYPRNDAVVLLHDQHWAGAKKPLLIRFLGFLKNVLGYIFGRLSRGGEYELGPGDFPLPPEDRRYA
jgi:peptidoglycan/xylan/chitin deacetylase (PgdA/CDA1 family)